MGQGRESSLLKLSTVVEKGLVHDHSKGRGVTCSTTNWPAAACHLQLAACGCQAEEVPGSMGARRRPDLMEQWPHRSGPPVDPRWMLRRAAPLAQSTTHQGDAGQDHSDTTQPGYGDQRMWGKALLRVGTVSQVTFDG